METKTYILVPREEWETIKMRTEETNQMIRLLVEGQQSNYWLTSEEARKLLGVSNKTWQEYRNRRYFPFAQIGRKIYVKRSDLEIFMENHSIKKH